MPDPVGFLVSLLVERAVNTALDTLAPRIDEVDAALSTLLDGQQRQLLTPYRQAISHLELRELDEAKKLLIEAEHLEQYAPVAKLILAMLLVEVGVSGDPVERRIRDVMEMNPLLIPDNVLFAAGLQEHDAHGAASWLTPILPTWSTRVDQLRLPDLGLPVTPKGRFLSTFNGDFVGPSGASIRAVAVARSWFGQVGYAVVQWAKEPYTGGYNERRMAAFDLATGSILWARTGKPAAFRVLLAAPKIVVLESPAPEKDSQLELLDATTGSLLRKMSAEAFTCLYWPTRSHRNADLRYRASHVELRCPDSVDLELNLPKVLQPHAPDSQLVAFVPIASATDSSPLIIALNRFSLLPRRVDGKRVRSEAQLAGADAIPLSTRWTPGWEKSGVTRKGTTLDPTQEYRAWTGSLYALANGR